MLHIYHKVKTQIEGIMLIISPKKKMGAYFSTSLIKQTNLLARCCTEILFFILLPQSSAIIVGRASLPRPSGRHQPQTRTTKTGGGEVQKLSCIAQTNGREFCIEEGGEGGDKKGISLNSSSVVFTKSKMQWAAFFAESPCFYQAAASRE